MQRSFVVRRLGTASVGMGLLGLAAAACHPHYAPLVRGTHYGAPAVLKEGQLEAGAAIAGFATPTTGGPGLAYALTDWLAVEAGANLNFVEGSWSMGYLGPRLSYKSQPEGSLHFLADFEAGFGAGVGGKNGDTLGAGGCSSCDDVPWHERLAYGGYQGLGIGGRFHWFSIYARGRVEESIAKNVALTFWPSAMLGLEFAIVERAKLGVGGGFIGYYNARDHEPGWFYQVYAAYRWDVGKQRATLPPPGAP